MPDVALSAARRSRPSTPAFRDCEVTDSTTVATQVRPSRVTRRGILHATGLILFLPCEIAARQILVALYESRQGLALHRVSPKFLILLVNPGDEWSGA